MEIGICLPSQIFRWRFCRHFSCHLTTICTKVWSQSFRLYFPCNQKSFKNPITQSNIGRTSAAEYLSFLLSVFLYLVFYVAVSQEPKVAYPEIRRLCNSRTLENAIVPAHQLHTIESRSRAIKFGEFLANFIDERRKIPPRNKRVLARKRRAPHPKKKNIFRPLKAS